MWLVLYTVRCGASRCLVTANSGRRNINCVAQIHDAAFWITRIKWIYKENLSHAVYMNVRNKIFLVPCFGYLELAASDFHLADSVQKMSYNRPFRRVSEDWQNLLKEWDIRRNTKIKRKEQLQRVSIGKDVMGKEERVRLHENKLYSRGGNVRYVHCVLLSCRCQRFLAYCHFGVFRAACALKPYAYRVGWCHGKYNVCKVWFISEETNVNKIAHCQYYLVQLFAYNFFITNNKYTNIKID